MSSNNHKKQGKGSALAGFHKNKIKNKYQEGET